MDMTLRNLDIGRTNLVDRSFRPAANDHEDPVPDFPRMLGERLTPALDDRRKCRGATPLITAMFINGLETP
jgi:hypothetical protein